MGGLGGGEPEMSDSSQAQLGDLPAANSSRSGKLRRVFVGERGLRVGWSVLLFAAIYLILDNVVTGILGHFIALDATSISLTQALLQEGRETLIVLLATWVMARIEKRPLLSYGYTDVHKAIRLVSGAAWGFLCLSVLVGVLWKTGLLVFDGLSLNGMVAWKYALGWALVFLVVGIFEESLFRGYLQYTLARGIGFWWAALALSVAFLLGHVSNGGESPLGLLEVGLGGFVFCLSLWYTKSLLWAVGFHAGWDWAQSYFYGTADSGLALKQHLLASHPAGNPLWSGGTVGPEGSLLILPLVIVIATGMWIWWGGGRFTTVKSSDTHPMSSQHR
jgi:membrane protease YdiL (CAAX protease family)